MRYLLAPIAVLVLAACARAEAPPFDHSAFDQILKANVRDERVDYLTIKSKHAPQLKAYLDALAAADVSKLAKADQLAFYINLYNASMIQAIIDRHHAGYTPAEKDYAVFKDALVRTGGKAISLNDLENTIIRPQFKDPRIHVALVCGARSCPPLLARAYAAADLDATLDANMKQFLSDPARNPIDAARSQLKLSKIFDWYKDDFGGAAQVPAFVGKVLGKDTSKWPVSFVEYDWALNIVP